VPVELEIGPRLHQKAHQSYVDTPSDYEAKKVSSSVSLDKKFKTLKQEFGSHLSPSGQQNDKSNKDLLSIQNTIERD
jgi:hypothetical protein